MVESCNMFGLVALCLLLSVCHVVFPQQVFPGLRPRTLPSQEHAQQLPDTVQSKQPVFQAEASLRCAVDVPDKVPCGQPDISAAECATINCCFDGQQCYYGKAGEDLAVQQLYSFRECQDFCIVMV